MLESKNIFRYPCINQKRLIVVLAILFATSIGYSNVSSATEQQQHTFATADAAFKALAEAYRVNDEKQLISIFGQEHKDFVIIADKTAARQDRLKFAELYDQYADIVYEDDRATLIIGHLGWPFPIPAVKDNDSWWIDTQQGKSEILNRRIGRNELATIKICNSYIEAQRLYGATDQDKDQVFEFTQKLKSSPGTKDGLYWKSHDGEEESPLGPLVSESKEYFEGKKSSEPVWGYYYRILTSQGDKVPGGRYDYVINGNMIAGFALVAYPAEYGDSGIMTFVVNHQGQIYEKDLGEDTLKSVAEMTEYNPDDTWSTVTP